MFFIKFGLSEKEKKILESFVNHKVENLTLTEFGKVSMTLEEARKRRRLKRDREHSNNSHQEVTRSEC
ncbi:hypothetical protein [Acinetobacter venetianus]|uniref:hypothetical protein n=1 Tax=Acinetobacter venetianus TaxID=52133 RepID=UPI0003794209|nr:hypothetical protein [Acinetobacter venetianus]